MKGSGQDNFFSRSPESFFSRKHRWASGRLRKGLKLWTVFLLSSLLFCFAWTNNVAQAGPASSSPRAKWTFMVYLDADNNLDPYGVADFNEMEMVGSTDQVNIVVLMDRFDGPALLYYVVKDNDPNQITSPVLANWGEVNMGDPATLARFVDYVKSHFPAEHYFLDLWDHGGGWYGLVWDEHDGLEDGYTDRLLLDEVAAALPDGGLDILGFDLCLAGNVETAYEVRWEAKYLLLSEEMEAGAGWPYDTMLADLVAKPSLDPVALAVAMTDRYFEYYESSTFMNTMAVVESAKIPDLVQAMDRLALSMLAAGEKGAVSGARGAATNLWLMMGGPIYYPLIDVYSFADELIQRSHDPATLLAAEETKAAVQAAVIYNVFGKYYDPAGGLTVYWPNTDRAFNEKYLLYRLDFVQDTHWDEFLLEYFRGF